MSREHARQMWQRIADGGLESDQDDPDDLRAWVRADAAKLLEADTVRDAVRPGTILEATGLAGRRERNAELRALVELLDEFSFLDADGAERAACRGDRMKGLIAMADSQGLRLRDESNIDLQKRIDRLSSTRKV